MKTEISYADWLDWLAFQLTFIELYKSATPPQKREMRATLRRLAEGIGQAELDAFVSQIPSFAEELSCFSSDERDSFARQFKTAVTEFAQYLASVAEKRD
ncbi:hypothetical protein [Candidatus Palauibacter irciniicola]|uniref:hypothetical protein n=1 Tax=Candidatus Palauibacter irciniicola TaxID=3056733 RepID=UPI003B014A54